MLRPLIFIILLSLGLFGLNHHFQSFDNTPKPIYDLPQTEIASDKPMQVIDPASGKLKVRGWSKFPNLLSYAPSMSKTYWPILSRDKQWNYFYVRTPEYLVTMAHANVGVIKSSYINVLKIGGKYPVTQTMVEDYFGSYVFIDVAKNGAGIYSTCDHPTLKMSFIKPEGDEEVSIKVNSHTDSHTISADLTGVKWSEGITHIEDQTDDGQFHSFNTKLLVEFVGDIKVNGNKIIECTKKDTCLGLHDNGRSIGKYMNTWVWGTLAFKTQKNKVGINISLAEKPQVASGDVLWIDGKLYKLDTLEITKKSATEWHITNHKGNPVHYPKNKVDITFKIANKHNISKNLVLIEIDFNSNFGYFSGKVESADGHKISFSEEFGFVEEMFSRW